MNKLRELLDEGQGLVGGRLTDESLNLMSEISRQEARLVDQLGALERLIAAKKGSI